MKRLSDKISTLRDRAMFFIYKLLDVSDYDGNIVYVMSDRQTAVKGEKMQPEVIWVWTVELTERVLAIALGQHRKVVLYPNSIEKYNRWSAVLNSYNRKYSLKNASGNVRAVISKLFTTDEGGDFINSELDKRRYKHEEKVL